MIHQRFTGVATCAQIAYMFIPTIIRIPKWFQVILLSVVDLRVFLVHVNFIEAKIVIRLAVKSSIIQVGLTTEVSQMYCRLADCKSIR